jgi:hypothetical protein
MFNEDVAVAFRCLVRLDNRQKIRARPSLFKNANLAGA